MPSHEIAKDDVCLTNLSKPGGLVKVLETVLDTYSNSWSAHIEHIEDHPYGYKKGSRGWYAVDDLIYVRSANEGEAIKPTIVCLCGSTRFSEAFQKANFDETLDGKIVLTIGCDMKSDTEIFK